MSVFGEAYKKSKVSMWLVLWEHENETLETYEKYTSIDYDQCFFSGNLSLKNNASFLKGIFSNVFSVSEQTKSLKCSPFLRLDRYILDESIWFGWINVIPFTFNMFHPCFIHKDVNSSITPLKSQFVLPKKIEIKIIDYDAYCDYNVSWGVSILRSKGD
jgi:hypothetical protein